MARDALPEQAERLAHCGSLGELELGGCSGREHLDSAPIMERRDWFLIREEQPLTVRKDQ